MYLTEAMIYLHANRLYHVLPLRYNRKFKKWGRNFFIQALGVWERNTPLAQILRFVLCVFRPCRELPPTGGYVRRRATYVAYSLHIRKYLILISCSLVLGRYRKGEAHAKKFIYSDDEAPQCPGKNLLYFKPQEAGKSVCSIWNHRTFFLEWPCKM